MTLGAHLGRRMRATSYDGEAWRLVQCEVCGEAGLVVRRINRRGVYAHALDGKGFTDLHFLMEQSADMSALRVLLGTGSTLPPAIRNDVLGAVRSNRAVKHWHQKAVRDELGRLEPKAEVSFPAPRTFKRIEQILGLAHYSERTP
jgi:hypothetical protein